MARKTLTLVVLAAGIAAISKAITEANPEDVAADILEIEAEKADALKKAEQAETDKQDALDLNDKHVKTIEKLSKKQPAKSEKTETAKEPDFEFEGDAYGFKIPKMHHKGRQITPEDVMADAALQKELITMQSGMIYKK